MVMVTTVYVFRRIKIYIFRNGQSAWWFVAALRTARQNATCQKHGSCCCQAPVGSPSLVRRSEAPDARNTCPAAPGAAPSCLEFTPSATGPNLLFVTPD